jgi:hypothetical protein
MGVIRVLVGFAIAMGITVAWILFACLVMGISLYVSRLIPLGGRESRKRPTA